MSKSYALFLALIPLLISSCKKDDSSMQQSPMTETGKPLKSDSKEPVIAIINPENGTAVWDTYLTVRATDNMGLKKIEIFEDGIVIQSWQAENRGKPVTSWANTYSYNPGLWDVRELTAVATDWSGNTSRHHITVYKLISCCTPPASGN